MRLHSWWLVSGFLFIACGQPVYAMEYAAIRLLPSDIPVAYIQCYKDTICIAPTLEGLKPAPIMRSDPSLTSHWVDDHTGQKRTTYVFPHVNIPVPPHTPFTVQATIMVSRITIPGTQKKRSTNSAVLFFDCTLSTRDADNILWGYTFYVSAVENALSINAAKPTFADIPHLSSLKFTVETKVAGPHAGITGRLTLNEGKVAVEEARKGDAKDIVHLEIRDASGKVVHTQDGDLEKFGFT